MRSARQEPSVLVVVIVRDGLPWLRQCLMGLAGQTYRRLGVLAVDNDSSDGSFRLLESALGSGRVIRSERNLGFSGAAALALSQEAARRVEYVLLLHDDVVLDPGAVAAMVEAAERVEGVGVVGPKVVDWDRPRVLREIGQSTDRFGYPYSPLEDDEIDQGQYDRIREVLYVSSCAMLVSRAVWDRIGPPDERLWPAQYDLDYCWRATLAGFRVLMTPKGVARHRSAAARGERPVGSGPARMRYHRERVALASILKNYGLLSLLWILPLYFVQGLVRVAVFAVSRRFQDAYEVLAAWAWNIVHLPGTLRRRRRAQKVRGVSDRSVRRSMAPAWIRLRRWWQTAALSLLPREREQEGVEPASRPVRMARFAASHPAAVAWALGVVVAAVAYRNLLNAPSLTGGGLGALPAGPSGFFGELLSGLRTTGLGGSHAASPALGILGVGSVVTLGTPAIFEKLLLFGLPAVAAAAFHRAIRQAGAGRPAATVGAACYGASSVVLWSISEGRIPVLVLLAGVPWLATKVSLPFGRDFRVSPARWVAGAALGMAVLASFFPGAVLSAAVLLAAATVTPGPSLRRGRGLGFGALALGAAALLTLPLSVELVRGGLGGMADLAGRPRFGSLARLSLGGGPGSWPTGYFLPAAAALAALFLAKRSVPMAAGAAFGAVVSIYLAWLAAAGYLPAALSNPPAYLAVAAFGFAALVGLGVDDLLKDIGQADFGYRRIGAVAMVALLVIGLTTQAVQAALGSWSIGGPERVEPAYAVMQLPTRSYRVLWIGSPDGDAFPAPGGLPDGTVAAGSASVRYAIRDPAGASALDIGRPAAGDGYAALARALSEILGGEVRHGGALLAPFGVRFVVARAGDLPPQAFRRLSRQVDLDLVPTRGLTIFRNQKSVPVAAVVTNPAWRASASTAGPAGLQADESLPDAGARALVPSGPGRFVGPATSQPALVLLSQQFDGRWRLRPAGGQESSEAPTEAFGWAVAFQPGAVPSGFGVVFGGQRSRTTEIGLIALLWAAALWLTRRQGRSG